ncbi:hypothetical protein C6988_06040 [Nitrosopumilus sp. b1]|uniref:hypothetical protein n=1 Tax=Nitrosopumilus sp. b1 TaxID=2109907 RepID=UPI0015F44DF4|nr:hypothetical protein [Nitrosopumilus sp. b1]KAF6242979.1 hypothetical protein C6988_06040 [Nitrosopumilus sp. b1]
MIEEIRKNFIILKQEFYKNYAGSSHIQEFLPLMSSDSFPISKTHLQKLIEFAESNPIYYNSFDMKINDISCRIYEGDINDYWINSLKHDSSYQPFYPTWILSAYLLALSSKLLGYEKLIDIGSGDGRIAYCGSITDLETYSIEIDESLVELQNKIQTNVSLNFRPMCSDAMEFDFNSIHLSRPEFFIGGLPQQGEMLAKNIISKIQKTNLAKESGFVLAGTYSKKQFSGNSSLGGWSEIVNDFKLTVQQILDVPTSWTFDQKTGTPYYFTKFQ